MQHVKVKNLENVVVLTPKGYLVGGEETDELEKYIRDLAADGNKWLVINLGDVSFMSSAGLTALLRARIRLRKRIPPGDLVLAEISPKLKETFELVGMNYIFQFYDTEKEAVGAC